MPTKFMSWWKEFFSTQQHLWLDNFRDFLFPWFFCDLPLFKHELDMAKWHQEGKIFQSRERPISDRLLCVIFEKIEIYNFKLWKVRPLLLELQVEGAGCRMEIMASRRLGWSQFETWILRRWHRKHIWNLLTSFTREKAKRTYFQF